MHKSWLSSPYERLLQNALFCILHSSLPNLDFQAGLSQTAQAMAFNVVERQNSKQQVSKLFLWCCYWFEAILIFSASSFLCILLRFYWHLLLAFWRGILSYNWPELKSFFFVSKSLGFYLHVVNTIFAHFQCIDLQIIRWFDFRIFSTAGALVVVRV